MMKPINESVQHVINELITEGKIQTGKPVTLRLYRGDEDTRSDFSGGTYWTSMRQYADSYGGQLSKVRVTLRNPFVVTDINDATDWSFDEASLKEQGHDSVVGYLRDGSKHTREPGIVVYLFDDVSDIVDPQ